ncbi:efflux transporter outer membrane subunit [Dyella caseinilytica]|uniref:Efflux transporter outer membrane subunit n=1 Tax=Dyella caseinilytica TaxID=1849581 RepID=A0ABX7GT82_9GAMM|nr:efflux transporter outer membrane subunit [Dyella caseinilytica]QRN53651.1 efflux transporter outer membrane subunit [Dyella caseinilytica]GFZ88216.1 RND transporter [Dyella caseinilytica]
MKKLELALSIALGVALGGCSLAPAYKTPVTPQAQAYRDVGPWVSAEPSDHLPRDHWWQLYSDPQLDQLQTQLLANNTDLAVALAHYQQAQAYSAEARSELFPQVGVNAGAQRQRESDTAPHYAAPGEYNTYAVGVQASYEVDLWGQVRNTVEAGRDNALAAQADLASVQLSLQAQLADAYMQLRGYDQQIALLQETIEAYQKALKLTQTLHAGGIVSGLDVSRAQTQLSDARSQWSQTVAQRVLMQDQIAVLVGENASSFNLPADTSAIAIPVIPLDVPSSLLQRRPDVAGAERRVAAANAGIGVARAAWFPSLTLGAQGGFESTGWANLLTAPNRIWALGPQLAYDLFDGGYRKATIAAAKAKTDEAGATYRGVVLGAFQQVQDNLALLDHLGTASVNQKDASDAAQHALDLSMTQYKHGAVSYLDVVTAQTTALQEKRGLLQLDTQRLRASVQLIRALGGGWSADQLARK